MLAVAKIRVRPFIAPTCKNGRFGDDNVLRALECCKESPCNIL